MPVADYESTRPASSRRAAYAASPLAMEQLSRPAAAMPPNPSRKSRRRAITSCDICRTRKVKCDRQHPTCSACRSAGRICLYEGSAARQYGLGKPATTAFTRDRPHAIRRRPRDSPRLDTIDFRLERLESVLEQLVQARATPKPTESETQADSGQHVGVNRSELTHATPSPSHQQIKAEESGDGTLLVSEDGDSQFISSHHWSLLATELRDIREILATDKDSDSAQIFPNDEHDITKCLPADADKCYKLLRTFEENVDPVVRLVHKPTVNRKFTSFVGEYFNASSSPEDVPADSIDEKLESNGLLHFRPLVFSIFYAAVNSLSASAVESDFGENKRRLMANYQRGLQLSLLAVDFFNTRSIDVLQAYVLFLGCQLRDESVGRTFTLLAAATRLAMAQGVNKEPTIFSPVPDEVNVEIRRRIWAQLGFLEWRAADLKGGLQSFDDDALTTRLPRNVDDSDLVVGRTSGLLDSALHSEEGRFTEMAFPICLFQMVQCARIISQDVHGRFFSAKGIQKPIEESLVDFDSFLCQKRELINTTRDRNMSRYKLDKSGLSPLQRLAKMNIKLMEWKCWLTFWGGVPRQARKSIMSDSDRRTLHQDSVALLEVLNSFSQDREVERFHWLLRACSAFQTVMVLISELRDTYPASDEDLAFRLRALKALRECVSFREGSESRAWAVIRKYVDQLEANYRCFAVQEEHQRTAATASSDSQHAFQEFWEMDIFQGMGLTRLDLGDGAGDLSMLTDTISYSSFYGSNSHVVAQKVCQD